MEESGDAPASDRSRSRRALALLRSVLGRLGWRYRLYLPIVIGLSAIYLLPPRFLQFFTESIEPLHRLAAPKFLGLLAGFGLAIAAALWVSTFFGGLLREWLRLRVSLDLRRESMRAMHATPLTVFDDAHRGDWMTRLTGDLHNVEEFLSDSIPQQIQSLTLVIGSAALFLAHSGPLALIPCGAALLLAWLNLRVQRRMAPVLTEARVLEGEVFQDLLENYEGLRTIRSSGSEAAVMTRFDRRLESVRRAGMRIIRSMAGLMGANELASQVVVTAVLTVLAWSVRQGSLTAADVLVYPFFINVFLGNTRALAASAYDWNRFFVEGGRLAEVLDHAGEEPPVVHSTTRLADTRTFSVTGLTLGYANAPPLLEDFDFTLRRGDLVAITGQSGSGKSTLLECLAGLRAPAAGRFRLDDGEEFSQAPTRLAAFVEQRPYLFVGTIRDNLTLGLATDAIPADDMLQARLNELGLSTVVRDRGGLDAVLTDRGLNLSEGQRYRLALCRALLSPRPFLFLDEPFASLDAATIRSILAALEAERRQSRGIIVVTHQLPEGIDPTIISLDRTPGGD